MFDDKTSVYKRKDTVYEENYKSDLAKNKGLRPLVQKSLQG